MPSISPPVVRVEDFGAKGDGANDDTEAINAAIASLGSGGTVMFASGKVYLKLSQVLVRRAGVKLWGYGATLYSVVTDQTIDAKASADLGVTLEGAGSGIYGFTIRSNLRVRLPGDAENGAVYLAGDGQAAVDNRIEYTQTGVLARNATNFLVSRNVIYRTTADGIHLTSGSTGARVTCNTVRETGDDMIAVVNYGPGEPDIGNFLIEGNDLAGQYLGRGIAVSGGKDVTIRHNKISNTTHGAGILIASEAYWQTASVRNVLVEDNDISDVQTTSPVYNPRKELVRTSQGGIDVYGEFAQGNVTDVLIRNNRINRTYKDGVLIRGNVGIISLEGNQLTMIGREAIKLEAWADARIGCTGNTLDGVPVVSEACETTTHTVTGAAL